MGKTWHVVWKEQELERSRAVLVKKYRLNPRAWPDGIDTKNCRWFTGHEDEWTDLRIARALGEAPPEKATVTPVTSTVTPRRNANAERQKRWREAKKLLAKNPPSV